MLILQKNWLESQGQKASTKHTIETLYKILGETVSQRTKFYREVGDKIFRPKLTEQAEASLLTLGGFAEVGRSCMLLETGESRLFSTVDSTYRRRTHWSPSSL